jgi:DNA-binding MarR family transcriptional regulator
VLTPVDIPGPTKPDVTPPRELLASSSFLLKRLGWLIKDSSLSACEAAGASLYHHAVLAVLDEGARETQATIADALGYDRSWLVGVLDELEEGGLIERRRDPADRRRQMVSLKPAGRRRLRELRGIAKRVEDEFLGALTAAERADLHRLLLQVAASHDPRYAGTR